MFNNNSQRPVRLAEILVKSLRIYRSNFSTIAIITLIINVPINLAVSIIPSFPFEAILTLNYDFEDFKYILLILAIQLFFAPIGAMAVAYLTRESLENKKVDVVSALNASFYKWFGLIIASLIFAVIIAVSSLAVVLPIYFFNVYGFYILAVILSGKSGYQALKHSKSLVNGRWFKVIFYWIIITLLNQCLIYIVTFASIGFPDTIVTRIISDSVLSVLCSYFVCVQTVWFLNLETVQRDNDNAGSIFKQL